MEWEIYLASNTLGILILALITFVHFIGTDKDREQEIEYLEF